VTVVLDSWAVLRYLEDTEPAAELVGDLLGVERPLMSWVNLGEVHYVLRRSQGEDAAIETVRDLRDVIEVRLPDEHLVLGAARVKADYPMAYADAFGAALSIAKDATLWTGDPELLVEDSPWHWRDLRSPA
jgi:predicted nucleic acid-binding protein